MNYPYLKQTIQTEWPIQTSMTRPNMGKPSKTRVGLSSDPDSLCNSENFLSTFNIAFNDLCRYKLFPYISETQYQ